jgi:hypothetical protein
MYAGAARGRRRVHRGRFGTDLFQRADHDHAVAYETARQVGIPLAALVAPTAAFAAFDPWFGLPGVLALTFLAVWTLAEAAHAPRGTSRLLFGALHVAQPIARRLGRLHARPAVRAAAARGRTPLPPLTHTRGRGAIVEHDRPRVELVLDLVDALRRGGLRMRTASSFVEHDASGLASLLVRAELLTSAHPVGWVQIRIRRLPAWPIVIMTALLAVMLCVSGEPTLIVGLLAVAVLADIAIGFVRSGPMARRALERASQSATGELTSTPYLSEAGVA